MLRASANRTRPIWLQSRRRPPSLRRGKHRHRRFRGSRNREARCAWQVGSRQHLPESRWIKRPTLHRSRRSCKSTLRIRNQCPGNARRCEGNEKTKKCGLDDLGRCSVRPSVRYQPRDQRVNIAEGCHVCDDRQALIAACVRYSLLAYASRASLTRDEVMMTPPARSSPTTVAAIE